jgi:phosphoesterase RecJ-like protein
MPDPAQQILDTLSKSKRVLITTHVRPDGDALGSTAAMVMGMKQKGIDAQVLLLSHLPRKYAFVYEENAIPFVDVENGWPLEDEGAKGRGGEGAKEAAASISPPRPFAPSPTLADFDALLVIDTGTWSQLPGLRERLSNFTKPKLIIDHHLTQEDWADVKLVDTSAGSAGEVVEELLMKWGVELDRAMSTALFLAIVSDTGWFMYSSTRPQTLRLASRLMETGVDTDRIYQLLKQNERKERIFLHARALQSLELLADGKLAVMTIRKQDFADTQAHVNDTEDLINFPLQIRSVEVSVIFVEPSDAGPVRISFRSKGKVDVAAFAQQFQGGGHARASGAKLQTSLEDAEQRVVGALTSALVATG